LFENVELPELAQVLNGYPRNGADMMGEHVVDVPARTHRDGGEDICARFRKRFDQPTLHLQVGITAVDHNWPPLPVPLT
jgi:hypothetical protein